MSRKSCPDAPETGGTPPETADRPDAGDGGRGEPERPPRPDPTRYGDWEIDGRCIDF